MPSLGKSSTMNKLFGAAERVARRGCRMVIGLEGSRIRTEVEAALMRHPEVLECAVIGVPDQARGQVVEAHVVLREGGIGNAAMTTALQDHVKAMIAPYKYPRSVRFVAALPKTATGKIQRFRLRDGGHREAPDA